MPSVPILKAKEIVLAPERAGFYLVRQRGSHAQYEKGNLLVTVPMHPGDLNPMTIRSILRQAKMTVDELIEYL